MSQIFPKPNFKPVKPKRKERGRITKAQYQLALDWFGDTCSYCNAYPVEMHHVVYRSNSGRGKFRNLMPLCKAHHEMAHSSYEFAESLREERREAFGEHFYMDVHDLYEMGLIEDRNEQQFENYMNEMGKNR